jgi:potassium-dependent mechanosensitive channel
MIVRRRGQTRRSGHLAVALALCLLFGVLVDPAWPQDKPSASPPPPIPVPEISVRSEEVVASLKALDERLATRAELASIEARLPAMAERIQRQLTETQRLLDSEPTLAVLTNLADAWRGIATDLAAWSDLLTREATVVEGELDRLNRVADQWARTRAEARRSQAPSTVLQRIDVTTTVIDHSRSTALARRAHILSLQARVAQQLALVQDAQARVARARGIDLSMLFRRDRPPVWRDTDRGPVPWREVPGKLWDGLVSEGALLRQFMVDRYERAIVHALVFVALLLFLRIGHRHARHWSQDDSDLGRVAQIFQFPISAALTLALMATFWLYPRPPLVLRNAVALLMLVPVIRILRRLTAPAPPIGFFALGAFFVVNRVREFTLDVPGLEQRIFVVEMLVAVVVVMIERALARRRATALEAAGPPMPSSSRVVVPPLLLWIALVALGLALVLGAAGYMLLARLIGDGVLRSAYAAMLLYASVRVADGLLAWALRSWPLTTLQMVRRHRALLERRLLRLLRWAAMFLWVASTLDALSLLDPVRDLLYGSLAASVTRGALTVSLGDVLAFVITVGLAFLASRLVRFVLEEDIYPRLLLARGLPYAVSVLVHYAILLLGFLFAAAALGVDMNRVTFLTGAFGVGVGFGLQSVVNNFVSGIILLLERPIQVGDVVQLGDLEGHVRRIGIRSTTVRTFQGAEVIVPNATFISDRVTNWTLSDRRRRIDLPVGVAYGADLERVLDLLRVTALTVPGVIPEPAPLALFKDFGDSALDFEIRAWTDRFEDWLIIKSRLGVAVNAAFKDAGIAIPSPQRDVTLRFPSPEET